MSNRRLLIAANWKMNPMPKGAADDPSPYREHTEFDVVVFPTFVDIKTCIDARLITGAQYGRPEENGAFTGDVSMKTLKSLGCHYVLCGHSERRHVHHEMDNDIEAQVIAALECGMHPIACIGEKKHDRKEGKEKEIIEAQLKNLPLGSDLTIAYEPVWAIGTGENATAEQAQKMHAYIRSLLPNDRKDLTRILYGGSVNAKNAGEFLRQPDIDGLLVGGASLKPEEFARIVQETQHVRE